MNEEIVERIMRLGIEHRFGVPLDKLWDLAAKQIKHPSPMFVTRPRSDFDDWKVSDFKFAFMYAGGILKLFKIDDPDTVVLVGWRNPTIGIPDVRLK